MTPESKLKQKLRNLLHSQGLWQTIETSTSRGVPDVAFICHVGTVWIEVKWIHDGRILVRPEQINWFWKATKRTGHFLIIAGISEILYITDMRSILGGTIRLNMETAKIGAQVYYVLPKEYAALVPYYALQDYFKNL